MIGTASAIMLTSLNFQHITQQGIYNDQTVGDRDVYERTLMIESYFLAAVYALFAVFSWFFFIHHPEEKEVVIKDDRLSTVLDESSVIPQSMLNLADTD